MDYNTSGRNTLAFFLIAILHNSKPEHAKIKVNTTMKNVMRETCNQLDEYYSQNGVFPTSLSMLETEFPENQKYFSYAYYPAENPTSYHIGITLRFKEKTDLNDDADFNSKAAGFMNGFDGGGQVFDIHVEN